MVSDEMKIGSQVIVAKKNVMKFQFSVIVVFVDVVTCKDATSQLI